MHPLVERSRIIRLLAVGLLAILASGCAVGNKHRYASVVPDLSIETNKVIAVAVQDQRPYVLDGDKEPNFVGIQRGGFGNPFDITTESGKALASDISDALVAGLKKKGVTAIALKILPQATGTEAVKILASEAADRLVLIKLTEWKSDTYQNTALIYDVQLQVFDAAGTLLAESSQNGRDDLGGSFMNPPAHAKTAVPIAFDRIFERLLNEPAVLVALSA